MARRSGGNYLILALFAVLALGGGMLSMAGFMPEYSTGFRQGYLQKASTKGIINKSVEGQLVLQGFSAKDSTSYAKKQTVTTSTLTNTWLFSATDPRVMRQLEAASGKQVTLHYKQWFWRPVFQQSTPYTIYKVQVNN